MNRKVERNYLEISYLEDLKDSSNLSDQYSISFVDPVDFQLNKFFYKNIGKSHHWVDRLVWSEKQSIVLQSPDSSLHQKKSKKLSITASSRVNFGVPYINHLEIHYIAVTTDIAEIIETTKIYFGKFVFF